jgi:Tfp pilus assembly protein PilE
MCGVETWPGLSRRTLRDERGFTVVELLVAMLIIAGGVIALLGVTDSSRRLTSNSERKEAAVHVAEQEIERIQARDYDSIALTASPSHNADTASPDNHVTSGSPARYRWNQVSGATGTEPFALDAVRGVDPTATTWSDGRLSGKLHRYVTWVDDAACGLLCPSAGDYKRITVAATIDGEGGPDKPILVSSLTSDPDTGPTEGVSDGINNVLQAPDTQCLEGGVWGQCAGSALGDVTTWFAYDTPATSSSTRQTIAGDHTTHPTVAALSALTCNLLIITTGCPKPDLLGETPAPVAGDVLPTLFNYSSEAAGSYLGGRVLKRDVGCSGTPSADNSKSHMWTTPPLDAAKQLTGAGGLTVYSQTLNGVSAGATLCVRFYDVPNSLLNLLAFPPTAIGTTSYTLASWPTSAAPVSFNFDFAAANVTVPAGNRIGMRVWPANTSGADIALVYDHPSYLTSIQLNSQ